MNTTQVEAITLEVFNHLDHFYGGLVPELTLGGTDGGGGSFVWVCKYGGMNFYRPMTIGEMFQREFEQKSSMN